MELISIYLRYILLKYHITTSQTHQELKKIFFVPRAPYRTKQLLSSLGCSHHWPRTPPKKGPFWGDVAPNWKIFLSMRHMHIIRCALDLCDPGESFEYFTHVCDVKIFSSRWVSSSKIPWKVTLLSEISDSIFEWKIWLFKESLNFKPI